LKALQSATSGGSGDYIQGIQGLAPDVAAQGTQWLQQIVDALGRQAGALLPTLGLFDDRV